MKRRSYTLVEILMVVGIIAILVGLAIPVLNSARSSARLNKASAECNAIAIAIKNFETEYGQMPNPADIGDQKAKGAPTANVKDLDDNPVIFSPNENDYSVGDQGTSPKAKQYRTFFSMLTGYQYSDPTKKTKDGDSITSEDGFHNNVKKMAFLDPTPAYANKQGFLDPWGKPYMILYKTDGELKNSFKLYATGPEIKLLTPIAVYTGEGLPGNITVTETTRYATSWGGIVTKPE